VCSGEGWTNGKEGLGGLGAVPGASSSDDDDYSEDSSDSRSCLGPLTGSREQHTITKVGHAYHAYLDGYRALNVRAITHYD